VRHADPRALTARPPRRCVQRPPSRGAVAAVCLSCVGYALLITLQLSGAGVRRPVFSSQGEAALCRIPVCMLYANAITTVIDSNEIRYTPAHSPDHPNEQLPSGSCSFSSSQPRQIAFNRRRRATSQRGREEHRSVRKKVAARPRGGQQRAHLEERALSTPLQLLQHSQ